MGWTEVEGPIYGSPELGEFMQLLQAGDNARLASERERLNPVLAHIGIEIVVEDSSDDSK